MKRILCYGDSNTFGSDPIHGGRHPEDVRWTCRLGYLLGEQYRVIEEGCGGRTTVWEDRIDQYRNGRTGLFPCIASHNPLDLVVIMLGTNDLKKQFHTTDWDLGRAMVQLIRSVRSFPYAPFYKTPEILIMSPVEIKDGVEDGPFGCFEKEAAERSRKFSTIYSEVAKEQGCYFFDAATVAEASETDCLHMDGINHQKLAAELAEYILCKL